MQPNTAVCPILFAVTLPHICPRGGGDVPTPTRFVAFSCRIAGRDGGGEERERGIPLLRLLWGALCSVSLKVIGGAGEV